jgi:GYF domain 2
MWHYGHSGQQAGPIPTEELIALCRSGAIPMNTLIWREGMAQWVPLPQAPELMEELQRLGDALGAAPALPMLPAPASAIASIICGSLAILGSCIIWGGILSIPAVITGPHRPANDQTLPHPDGWAGPGHGRTDHGLPDPCVWNRIPRNRHDRPHLRIIRQRSRKLFFPVQPTARPFCTCRSHHLIS